jgi:hypothetical protein
MSDTSELAEKISEKAPWWSTAPIWLAAGIVGVPSLLAIGAGYFIASTVTSRIHELEVINRYQLERLVIMEKQWEIVRRNLSVSIEIQLRACVREATNAKERDDCLRGLGQVTAAQNVLPEPK